MYIPDISDTLTLQRRSNAATTLPRRKPNFTLDTLCKAGVLGGDEAVSAMATVLVCENRRWLGWYSSPGSDQIAKRYDLLAKSRLSNAFSPGVHTDPSTLFELDGWEAPRFRAAHSDTIIEETGYAAALFMKECAARKGEVLKGRKTQAVGVTIAELNHVPAPQIYPKRINAYTTVFASVPIAISVSTCIACGVFRDLFSFSLILLGILANGVSSLVIGSAKLVFSHPDPAKGHPPGDGILSSDKEIVLLKGPEGAVNSITHGMFSLNFPSESHYKNIRWCSVLLTIHSIAPLLLIPHCSLFGQTMFVTSFGVSWIYNSWLPSLDEEMIQGDMLLNTVLQKPVLTKYHLGTHTTVAVFVLLVLQPEEPNKMLDDLLPGDTKVWRHWKKRIVERLLDGKKLEFVNSDWELDGFSEKEQFSLETLYGDAQAAYGGYVDHVACK